MAQQLLTNFTPPGSTSSYKFRAGGLFFGTSSGTNSAMNVSIPGVSEYYNGLTIILTIGDTITPASNCTLAINNLGAKSIKYGYNGDASHFASGATYLFVYDGTSFKGIHSENIDTTYQLMDLTKGKEGTDDTTGSLLTPYRLKQIINNFAPTKTGSGASGNWNINAATATEFSTDTNVTLTGDLTGSSSSPRGWNIAAKIKEGVVTNEHLAGDITNDKLANSSFSIQHGGVDYPISLGDVVSSTDLSSWLGLTNYSAGTGLVLNGTTFNHSNSITAKTSYAQNTTSAPGYAGTFKVFEPKYDAQGHITGVRTTTVTMPSAQTIPTSFNIAANGSDDGIVTLSKSGGANQVSYSVAHKKVFGASTTSTNKYSSDNTTTSITSSGTIKIPQISVDEYGHVYAAADENVTITMPTALKNPKALTVGSKTYDGSAAITIAASDLGLSNALHFIGVKDAIPTSGTYTNGDVILVGNKEYVYSNSAWVELGDESSFALKTITISGANGLTGSGTLAGNITLSHADTSSQGSVSASGRRYITGVTLDGYGHVTGLTTGTETVTDTHYTTKLFATGSSGTAHAATTNGGTYLRLFDNNTARQSIKIVGSGATKVTSDANGVITITSTDNNTTYSVATESADGLLSKEDKIKLNNTNIAYGTCSTAAATPEKVITLNGNTQWALKNGSLIMVKFANSNTASNVTFNVNGTGAYPIWYNNEAYVGSSSAYTGYKDRTITYMFNGTHWVWISSSYDANTQSNTNSTNTDSKIFIIGATSQGSNKTTYSHDTAYVGTDGCLYSNSTKVSVEGHTHDQYLQNAYTSIGVNSSMRDAVGATSLNFKNGSGISLSIGAGKNEDYDITITNAGVRSITSGSTNGTISVNTNGTSNEVAIKGLKSAAYTDESSYIKSISIETVSGNLTPVLKYTKSNGTTTVGNIDFRVLQSKLPPHGDSYSAASIPILLSNPAARGNNYTGTSYYSEMKYCPDTGYLEGIKIDCGIWESFNGDIDDCCFIAGTQVLIDLDGNTKNIEDIRPGDSAIAYNLTEEKNYLAIVKEVHVKHDVTDVAIVNFENGATLIMNAYHPIYTVNGYHSLTNHNGYDMLSIGDNCRTEKGWSKIISIDRYNSTPITMYSLDVIDINENIDNDINDNFFANGIVVHNAGCPT